MAPTGRFPLGVAGVVIMLVGAISGFSYRAYVDYGDIANSNQLVLEARSENQELKSEIAKQDAELTALQTKLKSVQDTLDALMPAENTYNLDPNQALIIAGGRMTIGLVRAPGIEAININVNGKQYVASAGAVINIELDPTTTCQVGVQSFDVDRRPTRDPAPTRSQST